MMIIVAKWYKNSRLTFCYCNRYVTVIVLIEPVVLLRPCDLLRTPSTVVHTHTMHFTTSSLTTTEEVSSRMYVRK